MARASRKNLPLPEAPVAVAQIYRTALYARLSVEDNGKEQGNSLENQLALLEQYVAGQPFLQNTAVFIDNGFTGTDFHRPQWTRLLQEVKQGNIDCIVVKDLSRLGRNYIETGDFIEKICPFLNLRLIAVNDHYDTADLDAGAELGASLKNIMNDYYAKDISRKSASALKAKRCKGDYIGNYAPHGYLKDPDNKNKLIIDPESASVIQYIFQCRSTGDGISTITRKLNDQDIPSPGRLRYQRGIATNNNQKGKALLWNRHVTTDILKNVAYIGHLAQGRSSSAYHRGIPFHWVDATDWDVVENTHPPIISMELWEQVQAVNQCRSTEHRKNYGKYDHLPKAINPYGKKLVCAECGRALKLVRSIARGGKKAYFHYKCSTQIEHGTCTKNSIPQMELDNAIFASLQLQIQLFLEKQSLVQRLLREKRQKPQPFATEISNLEQTLKRKQNLCTSIYTDQKEGLLTMEEYLFAKETYQKEIQQLQQQLAEKRAVANISSQTAFGTARLAKTLEEYSMAEVLSSSMVEALVEQITVTAEQTIDLQFRYDNEFAALMEQCQRLQVEVAS